MVFFKAKDTDVLTAAFKEYFSKLAHREKRLSVLKAMVHLKGFSKPISAKTREKKQEEILAELKEPNGELSS